VLELLKIDPILYFVILLIIWI